VDTNVVIEAVDTGCWAALLNQFDIRTVAEVRRETQAGQRRIKSYVVVDKALFDAKVKVAHVTKMQVADAQLRTRLMTQIDPGERDLLAYVAAQDTEKKAG
jgi:predicted nucleic acid-binding protein